MLRLKPHFPSRYSQGRVVLPTRMGWLSLIMLMPLALLLLQLLVSRDEQAQTIDRKLKALNDIRTVQNLVDLAERLRDLSVIVVYDRNHDLDLEYARYQQAFLVELDAVNNDQSFIDDNPIFQLSYPQLLSQIQKARPAMGAEVVTPTLAFGEHQNLVSGLQHIQFRLADQAGLFNERQPLLLSLIYLALDEYSDLATDLGRARSFGSLYLRIGHVPSDGIDVLESLYERMTMQHERINLRVAQLLRNHNELKSTAPFDRYPWSVLLQVADALDQSVLQSADLDTPWRDYYQNISQLMVETALTRDQLLKVLHSEFLTQRKGLVVEQRTYMLGLILMAILLALIYVADRRAASRQEKVEKEKQAAEEADKAKSQFLATMSHEIRTPINGVLGMVDLLDDTPLDVQQRNYLDALKSSGQTLLAVINDVLDYSKIEAGKLQIDNTTFDLRELVKEIGIVFEPMFKQKGVEFNVKVEASVPELVCCDSVRLRQIVLNLVGNALKFTEKGRVDVRFSCNQSGNQTNLYGVVRDSGIGMDKDQQTDLFKQFSQTNKSISRRFGGTGLGLAICQRLCQLMGGEIGVSSKRDVGTTFWFTLLLHPVEHQLDLASETEEHEQRLLSYRQKIHGKRALVAEDNKINQMVIEGLLKKMGVVVDLVENGKLACARIMEDQKKYDVILMDWEMPELSGVEACLKIRQWEKEQGVDPTVIVALTAHALSDYESQAYAVGMQGFLVKPVEQETLLKNLIAVMKDNGQAL